MNNDERSDTNTTINEPAVDIHVRQGIRIRTNEGMHYGRVWLVDTMTDGSERLTEIREIYYAKFEADASKRDQVGQVHLLIGGGIQIDINDPIFRSMVEDEAIRLAKSFEISDNHDSEVKQSLE